MTTKNFDGAISFSNGDPVLISKRGAEVRASYKDIIALALSGRYPEDDRLPAGELYKRGKLADIVDAGGDIDLKATDMTMIKDYVAKAWPPRIISAVHDKVDADYTPASFVDNALRD